MVRQEIAYEIISREHPTFAIRELIDCAQKFEELGDHPLVAYTHARVASILLESGQHDEAWGYLKKAVDAQMDRTPHGAYIYRVQAEYALSTKNYQECVRNSEYSAELFARMGLDREFAKSLNICVECYLEQGMLQEALVVSRKMNEVLTNSNFGRFDNTGGLSNEED